MSSIGSTESTTQQRVNELFVTRFGYRYLGNWKDRENNSNLEEDLLRGNLLSRRYTETQIRRVVEDLRRTSSIGGRDLNHANQATYQRLRYGVPVKVEVGGVTDTVWPIDWTNPAANDFAIAEEVTLKKGGHERRPDLVLYVNGIALVVIELNNSRISLGDGIRQLISNQSLEFNRWFFTTTQLLIAGSNSEGLKYNTAGTPEKYYLRWKDRATSLEVFGQYIHTYKFAEAVEDEVILDLIYVGAAQHPPQY